MNKVILFISLISIIVAHAQNLVTNPGFEIYSDCPTNLDQLYRATGWYNPAPTQGTPDYYVLCGINDSGIPVNGAGNQEPYDGNAYGGIFCFGLGVREYIQTRLSNPLIAGHLYKISFYASLADSRGTAIDKLSAFVSKNPVTSNSMVINVLPQVTSSNMVSSWTTWSQIFGTFMANGDEEYLTIGNFLSDANTPNTIVNPNAIDTRRSYYYIDQVEVIPIEPIEPDCDCDCLFIGNPVNDVITIDNGTYLIEDVTIVEMSGKVISKKIENSEIYVGNLQQGTYMIKLSCKGKNYLKKFIKL